MAYRRSVIKSIQTGSITLADSATSATGTISAVVLANSVVQFGGYKSDANGQWSTFNPNQVLLSLVLTNTTTVTAAKDGSFGPAGQSFFVRYTVIEYYPGVIKSSGSGTIVIGAGATSNTATITSVATAKTAVYCTGIRNSAGSTEQMGKVFADIVLTNATTLTATRGIASAGDSTTVAYQYVEFN